MADALSRLDKIEDNVPVTSPEAYYSLFEDFQMQETELTSNPLTYSQLEKAQQADSEIKKILAMEKICMGLGLGLGLGLGFR